jgi:hypothetical protein
MNKFSVLRPLCVIALLFSAAILLRFFPRLMGFAVILVICYAGIRNFLHRVQTANWLSKWALIRFVRRIRKSFGTSPTALALYAGCFALSCVTLLTAVAQYKYVALFSTFLTGILLCVATALDWYVRLKYVLSSAMMRKIAKIVIGFLATATVFFSTVLAKQLTHSIAQADPSSLPEFVRIVSAFVFPFALSAVISVSLTLVMIVQYAVLLIGLFFITSSQHLANFFSTRWRAQLRGITYRIVNGKKPPIKRAWWEITANGVQFFLRPVGSGAFAALIICLGLSAAELAGHIPSNYLQIMLVKTEYRHPHLCENVSSSSSVAYLQDGYVSVATKGSDGYVFSTVKCHN